MAHEDKSKEIASISIKKAENGFSYTAYWEPSGDKGEMHCSRPKEYVYESIESVLEAVKDDLASPHVREEKKPNAEEKEPNMGEKKYGKERFQKLASKGKKLKGKLF